MRPKVLLLHGIWLRPFSMALLQRRLQAHGWQCEAMAYGSIVGSTRCNVQALSERLQQASPPMLIVAHSLGGLLALHALAAVDSEKRGALLCLGTPLQGSAAARRLHEMGLGVGMGHSCELLCQGWQRPLPAPTAMLAGSRGLGVGHLLARLPVPHDGTVSVAETCCEGLSVHQTMATSHSGLLLSSTVAARVSELLEQAARGAWLAPSSAP